MAISFPRGACAADGWNVSVTIGHDMPQGGRLSVFRGIYGHDAKGWPKFRNGDHDGREFASHAEYEAFVRARGYVVPFLTTHGEFKARHRAALRQMARDNAAAIRDLPDRDALVSLANASRAAVQAMGCSLLESLRWSNGVYSAAYHLRPDLRTPFGIAA